MNVTRSVLASWLLAVVIPAQAGQAPKPAPDQVEYDKLVAEWTAAMKTYTEANKQLMASEEYKKARAEKDTAKARELMASVSRPDGKAFGTRALELADKNAGDDGLRFLVYAAANFNDKDTSKAIAERVLKNYLKSPKLGDLLEHGMALSRALGAEEGDALLERVKAESPHALPKAWAMYWQGQSIQQGARLKKDATAEEKAENEAKVAKADALFAAAGTLAQGTEHADRIGAPQFEKERLQVGMEVPDIVGEDVDGVPFKLSDYRGKVVMIDYWGFW